MKKLNLILFLLIWFSACSAEEKTYVKDIFVQKSDMSYKVTFYCFDFKTGEGVIENVYSCDELEKIISLSNLDYNYSFRLCENIYISTNFAVEFDNVMQFINKMKLPVTSKIYFSDKYFENIESDNIFKTSIYNLSENNERYSGSVTYVNNDGNAESVLLFLNGNMTEVVDKKQWYVLNILTEKVDDIKYSFKNDELYARLKLINTNYLIKDDVLYITINLELKENKGTNNSITSSRLFYKLLEIDLKNEITAIYNNFYVNQLYNLNWYAQQEGKAIDLIEVSITII